MARRSKTPRLPPRWHHSGPSQILLTDQLHPVGRLDCSPSVSAGRETTESAGAVAPGQKLTPDPTSGARPVATVTQDHPLQRSILRWFKALAYLVMQGTSLAFSRGGHPQAFATGRDPMETNALTPLNKILDLLLDAICVVDVEGRYVFVSAAFERIFGYTPAEVLGKRMIELVHPQDREITLRTAAQIMAGQHQSHFHNRYIRKNGEVVHIMWSARWSEADQVRIAVARDITELKRSESLRTALHAIAEAAHAAESLHSLFEQTHRIIGELMPAENFAVALCDQKSGEISFPYVADEQAEELPSPALNAGTLVAQVIRTGQPALQSTCAPLAPGSDGAPDACERALHWLAVPLNSKDSTVGALIIKSYADATRYTDADKELLQLVSNPVAAAVERKLSEARLHHLAQHDSLTDLPNRKLFYRQFDIALDNARRHQHHVALLYIDLDRFKQVNDSFGHHIGDLLLCEVAARIRRCLRECDVVGRVGGDEFVVLLNAIQSPGQGMDVAERIREALSVPFDLADQRVRISTSIGVANFPAHSEDPDLLTKAADHAMYHAKKEGGNRALLASSPNVPEGESRDPDDAP